jgi:hypothetical protein
MIDSSLWPLGSDRRSLQYSVTWVRYVLHYKCSILNSSIYSRNVIILRDLSTDVILIDRAPGVD